MFKKILVATDGSDNSMRAVQAGGQVAEAMDASLILVYAAYVPSMYGDDLRPEIRDALREEGRRILASAAGLFKDSGIKPEEKLLFDEKAEDGILRLASGKGYDLIVVGSRGKDAGGRKRLGSTSMRVIEHAPCPVMIVH